MNKSELINAMAEEAGLSKADAKKALDVLDTVDTKASNAFFASAWLKKPA